MSTIWLIRHGSTEANLRHLYCGSTDLPLAEAGRKELAALRYPEPAGALYTSGMRRTDETLRILFGDRPFTRLPDLREIDFGAFEMHSYEELKEDPAYQRWISGDNMANVPPAGESGEAMTRRVLRCFHALRASGADAVLVTHGGVIAAIMADAFPEEGKSRYAWQPRPGRGYCLQGDRWQPLPPEEMPGER